MIELLLTIAIIFIIVSAFTSPFESLGWWAGSFGKKNIPHISKSKRRKSSKVKVKSYIVYLTGVGGIDGKSFGPFEKRFVERLKKEFETSVVIEDIFPYSVTNNALTGERTFSWFWKKLATGNFRRRFRNNFILLRNMFQVLVSSDKRYGPIYNQGTAQLIYKKLLEHGYDPVSKIPIAMIGYSGGGQISIGATTYLKQYLPNTPIHIFSLGGVFASDAGLLAVDTMTHLHGKGDVIEKFGPRLFPSRWQVFGYSNWNIAIEQGKVNFVDMGNSRHNGKKGYLDNTYNSNLGRKTSNLDDTIAEFKKMLNTVYAYTPPHTGKSRRIDLSVVFSKNRSYKYVARINIAKNYNQAVKRIRKLQLLDNDRINPVAYTQFLSHGRKTKRTAVLFHGFTATPNQFLSFGKELYKQGFNVLLPRQPYHGYKNTMTTDLEKLKARDLISHVNESINIANGLGEKIFVVGLSGGASLSTWAAQTREDVYLAMPISPVYGPPAVPKQMLYPITLLLEFMKNKYVWWSPKLKDKANFPKESYMRFPTKAIKEYMKINIDVINRAQYQRPAAEKIISVTNDFDQGINRHIISHLDNSWQKQNVALTIYRFPEDLRLPHNMISKNHPMQKTDIVYPKLISLMK